MDAPTALEERVASAQSRSRPERARCVRRVTAIAILSTWLLAAGLIAAIRTAQPTPQSIAAFCARHPLAGELPATRARIITTTAGMIALLNHEQRRELSDNQDVQRTYTSLTTLEKEQLIQLTLPSALKEAFQAASAQPASEREGFLNEAFYEMEIAFSRDRTAPVNQSRVQSWLHDAIREALLATPQRTRPQIQRAIEGNFPGAIKRF